MLVQFNNRPLLPVTLPSKVAANDPNPGPPKPGRSVEATSLIRTTLGLRMAKDLSVGDHLYTRSGTPQPLTRIDHIKITTCGIHDDAALAPVRFDPGALPGMSGDTAILLSPDCPVSMAADATDTRQFPARAHCNGGMIRRVIPDAGIHYIRLGFQTPQDICLGGLWVTQDADATPWAMPR